MKSIVILISGRGSNMESLLNEIDKGNLDVRVAAVLSNRPDAKGLETAQKKNIPVRVLDHKNFSEREAFDRAMMAAIDEFSPDLVVLAGFMRILTEAFVEHYEGRLLNIHPSLLPSFPGLHTHQRAIDAGVKVHGCTVHFVTPALDHGPIVIQAAVPVIDGDTEASLSARVLACEHQVYPQAVKWFVEGKIKLVGDRVMLADKQNAARFLIAPEKIGE